MNYEHYIAGTQENNIIKHGDNHKTFALVNKYCKNAEQSAKGIWLYLIQQYKNDRRDKTYYICKPIRCLAPEKTGVYGIICGIILYKITKAIDKARFLM